jgi:hypothetical protein
MLRESFGPNRVHTYCGYRAIRGQG